MSAGSALGHGCLAPRSLLYDATKGGFLPTQGVVQPTSFQSPIAAQSGIATPSITIGPPPGPIPGATDSWVMGCGTSGFSPQQFGLASIAAGGALVTAEPLFLTQGAVGGPDEILALGAQGQVGQVVSTSADVNGNVVSSTPATASITTSSIVIAWLVGPNATPLFLTTVNCTAHTLTFTLVKFQQNPAPPGPVTACGFVPAAGGNADCKINYFIVRY